MARTETPKLRNVRRKIAEEIFHLVYSKEEKNFRKMKIEEIDHWMAEMGFLGNETPTELAREWQEFAKSEPQDW